MVGEDGDGRLGEDAAAAEDDIWEADSGGERLGDLGGDGRPATAADDEDSNV